MKHQIRSVNCVCRQRYTVSCCCCAVTFHENCDKERAHDASRSEIKVA